MPRVCTICAHLAREAIDRAIVAGGTNRAIAHDFACSEDAIKRHRAKHIPALLRQAKEAEDQVRAGALQAQADDQAEHEEQHALDVMTELRRCFERINLLFDACDRWLRDPDDPARYDIGPRADDVIVIYQEPGPDGRPVRRKAPISALLTRIVAGGVQPVSWESKQADPRDLVLKAAAQLQSQTELLGELLGELERQPAVNVLILPEWIGLRSAIMAALDPFPDAKRAVVLAIGGPGYAAG